MPGGFITDQHTQVVIPLAASDSLGNPVTYSSASASVGTVDLQGYTLTYTPDMNTLFQGATVSVHAGNDFDGLSEGVTIPIDPASPRLQ